VLFKDFSQQLFKEKNNRRSLRKLEKKQKGTKSNRVDKTSLQRSKEGFIRGLKINSEVLAVVVNHRNIIEVFKEQPKRANKLHLFRTIFTVDHQSSDSNKQQC